MSRPLIKICGLTNLADAQAAIAAGAQWLGFIFVPGTPRALTIEQALPILTQLQQEAPDIRRVGVFMNASPAEIQAHLQALALDAIQLHGNELPQDYAGFQKPIIKTLLLAPDQGLSEIRAACQAATAQPSVEALLLDLPKGSGLRSILDWPDFEQLPALLADFPCLVAGGLTPDNIAPVLDALRPMGVDVASGVEAAPGRKDIHKLQAFCRTIQAHSSLPPVNRGDHRPCNP